MSITDEIERLERLRTDGALSDEEFQEAKSRVIQGDANSDSSFVNPDEVFGMDSKTWCMMMHLSQLLNFAAGAGTVVPIVMWLVSKEKNADADRHGVAILNWIITFILLMIVSGVLTIVGIGIIGLIVFAILSVVFPIIGAIKSINGEFWEYPMSIKFIRYAEDFDEHSASSF